MSEEKSNEERKKQRKILNYWVLGILMFGVFASTVFYKITHFTRVSQGDSVSTYEKKRLLNELESGKLPISKKENVND